MAPIEVTEVDMFDKTIRVVKELNMTSDANDTGKFFYDTHEGSNDITRAINVSLLYTGPLILVLLLIHVCRGCYCGGRKITKWWKNKANIPRESPDTTQSTPPVEMKVISDNSIETNGFKPLSPLLSATMLSENIPQGQGDII